MPARSTLSRVLVVLAISGAGCGGAKVVVAPRAAPGALAAATRGVVAVATRHSDGATTTLCSGTLVAPNLVLTARHCVSHALTSQPACDTQGESHNGNHLADDEDPATIAIYVGDKIDLVNDEPRAHVTKTLRPTTDVLCDADIAFIVLDHDLDGVEIVPMRLERSVGEGEWVVPVGFGGGVSGEIGTRAVRGASRVLSVGPAHNDATGAVLGPREFEVAVATCKGDSGGPAIDAWTGDVVGVVSRGGSCETNGNHVYTRLDAFSRLATQALTTARTDARTRLALRVTDRLGKPW
ncbi:hypothetical protein BH09MYX1_BH09MYX1_42170 [soil metagenome]